MKIINSVAAKFISNKMEKVHFILAQVKIAVDFYIAEFFAVATYGLVQSGV